MKGVFRSTLNSNFSIGLNLFQGIILLLYHGSKKKSPLLKTLNFAASVHGLIIRFLTKFISCLVIRYFTVCVSCGNVLMTRRADR